MIEEIKRIDENPDKAKYMIGQSSMRSGYDFGWEEYYLAFLTETVKDGLKQYDHIVWKTSVSDIDRPSTFNHNI